MAGATPQAIALARGIGFVVATEEAVRGERWINDAIRAARQRRPDVAGGLILRALDAFAALTDAGARRDELAPAAEAIQVIGHPDLALIAMLDALEIDEAAGDQRKVASDLLTLGNVQSDLGRTADAERSYERSLRICEERGYRADAASSSTNLAVLMANSRRLDRALDLLKRSLVHLAAARHPDTEVKTRLALIQVVDAASADPAVAVHAAEGLFERCARELRPEDWSSVEAPFFRSVDRLLAAQPGADRAAWLAKNFPQLHAGREGPSPGRRHGQDAG